MQNYKNYHISLVLITFKYETSVSQLHNGYVLILLPKTNWYIPELSEMCSIEVYVITNGQVHLAGWFFPQYAPIGNKYRFSRIQNTFIHVHILDRFYFGLNAQKEHVPNNWLLSIVG